METNFLVNPWNLKCASFDSFVNDSKKENVRKDNFTTFNYLKSVPYLFRQSDDLVSCNICNILICKTISLNHAKLHDQKNEDVDLIYTIYAKIEADCATNDMDSSLDTPKKISGKCARTKLPVKIKEKKHKSTVKTSLKTNDNNEDVVIIEEDNVSNFVPKSTLNAANPLRIKIQLLPKFEVTPKNGNIFENLQTLFPNSNLTKHASFNGETDMRMKTIDLTGPSPKKDQRQMAAQLVSIQKYQPRFLQNVSTYQSSDVSSRLSVPTATILQNGPQIISNVNQTSSMPRRIRVQSHQSPRLPRVFQSLRTGVNFGNILRKKHVQVQSFHDTLHPVSSTQSLDVFNNLDENQLSFQKILIDNGMFSQEDILRCKKPSTVHSINYSGQFRKVTNASVHNPKIRLVQSNPSSSKSSSDVHPRLLNNAAFRPFFQKHSNPNYILGSQEVKSNVRNVNTYQKKYVELSDEEFYLDSSLMNSSKSQRLQHSASSTQISSQFWKPMSKLPTISMSHSSNDLNNFNLQLSASRDELQDTDVHYLPPPEETITSLSWEI